MREYCLVVDKYGSRGNRHYGDLVLVLTRRKLSHTLRRTSREA